MIPERSFGPPVIPVVYRLNFRDASSYFLARKFVIRDKDLIYVANHPINELQKVFSIFFGAAISPPMSAAATGAAIYATHP